ncbi:MAG TPA: hypothetical protein ENJ09_04715 [Planctomycetes bacterium]|nr:hypothetical protein [Planctomycetota bacterium]
MAGAAGLVVALVLGWLLSNRFSGDLSRIRGERQRVAAELEHLEQEAQRAEAARATLSLLEKKQERLRTIERMGVPLDALLAEVVGAFQGHADLLELSMTPGPTGEGFVLHATGSATSDPLRLAAHLESLTKRLEAVDGFESVEVQLPDRLPEGTSLRFQLTAEVSRS